MPEQMTTYVLQWQEDAGSRRKAEKGIQSVVDESKDLSKAQSQVVSTAQKASKELEGIGKRATRIQSIARAFQEAANAGDNTFQAAEKAARALDRLGASEAEIAKVKQELGLAADQAKQLDTALGAVAANEQFSFTSSRVALAGDVQSNLGAVRGLAGTAGLGGAAGGIGVAGEFVVLAEELPRLKTALAGMPQVIKAAASELGAGGIGFIGGLAALAIAFTILTKRAEETRKEVTKDLDERERLNAIILTGSREAIQAERDKLEASRQANILAKQQIRDQIAGFSESELAISGFLDGIGLFGKSLNDINLTDSGVTIEVLNDRLKELNETQLDQKDSILVLDEALNSAILATQEAAAAELDLAKKRSSDLIGIIRERADLEIELQKLITDQNKQAIQERIADYQKEIDTLAIATQLLELTAAFTPDGEAKQILLDERDANVARTDQIEHFLIPALEEASSEVRNWGVTIFDLSDGLKEVASELDQAVPAFSKFSDALREAQTVSVAQIKLNNELESISQKGADKIAAIRSNLADKEADLLRNLGRSIADARTKANQALQDLDRKQSADLLKIEEDYARQRAKIVRDANRDINAAISDRDVLAFTQAKQTRDEQLDDAKQGYDEQRQELQRSYQQQLQDISINLQRQEQEIRLQYNRQLQDVQQAAQAQIQLEQQRISAELRLRQAGYNAMLQSEQAFVQAQINLFQGLATAGGNILNSLGSAVSQATASAGGGAVNTALNLAGGGGVNVLAGTGGNTNNVNMTNNFPQGVNTNQIVTTVLGQINNLIGN